MVASLGEYYVCCLPERSLSKIALHASGPAFLTATVSFFVTLEHKSGLAQPLHAFGVSKPYLDPSDFALAATEP